MGEGESAAKDTEGSGDLAIICDRGQDQKRGLAVGREIAKGVMGLSSAQTSSGQPGGDAGGEIPGKTAALGRLPCCGHCLKARSMPLSAAQGWFLPPLNREMSFRVKFLTQKFINLLQWLVTFFFFFFPILSPGSKNTYSLFSCYSLFCLPCSQRAFLSSVLGPCLTLHELHGHSAKPGARSSYPRKVSLTDFPLGKSR